MRKLYFLVTTLLVALCTFSTTANAQASHLVISQVYGGGGNTGATYKNDFIEIYNPTGVTVSLTGWSVQYASSTGTTWQVTPLSGSIAPGSYYLVQQAAGAAGTVNLPTPDVSGTIAMAAGSGKVALVSSTTALAGGCPTGLIDFVGFGTANCFEGTAGTPTLTNTTAAIRKNNGCTDTDNNANDFVTGAPAPKNSASPTHNCTSANAPTALVAAGVNGAEPATDGTFTVSLSAPAPAGGVTVQYTLSGTATAGTDYSNPQTGSITIPSGSSTGTITITALDDSEYEGTEKITITLNSATGGYLLSGSTADIDLLDNDNPPPPTVVINQVYGGGGNAGALYTHDFIELYNYGNAPVSLAGWSLQYSSAAGTGTWAVHSLTGTIPAHSFFLVQEAKGNGGTKALPTPDAIGGLALSATAGKVILSNTTTQLSGADPKGSSIIDKIGYGSSATGFETAPTPDLSNTTAAKRVTDGVDTHDNSVDFIVSTPLPRNSTYTTTPPVITSVTPPNGYADVPVNIIPMIVFDKPVQKGTGTITLLEGGVAVATLDVTSTDVVLTDNFTAAIKTTFAPGKTYTIQVAAGTFKDLYGNAFTGLTAGWTFTTYNSNVAVPLPATFDFNSCPGNGLLPRGFTRYSVSGAQQWDCSTFGRNTSSAVEMNGYDGNTNIPNVDWLISPRIDLTGTTYPLLSFWSITAFNGKPLQLKISTNYTGGDPALATWTDLNGKFPAEASRTWTESKDINLARFISDNVHIAFVYTSSNEDGARWTLDDLAIANSTTPPPPSLTVGSTDVQLGYAATGSSSDKTFTFTGNDLVEDVTLTTSAPFQLSKDGSSYATSLTYSVAEANNAEQTVWVRFAPAEKNKDFTGTVTVSTSALSGTVALKGTSINPEGTLEVVNWNVEWFGSPEFGPGNDDLQEKNVIKVFQNLNADIYALGEIVSEERLARVVSSMPGYTYVIGNFGSHTNPYANNPSPLNEAQKLAFVYKTSVIKNLGARPMLSVGIDTKADISNKQYNNWSSGRFPFLMEAEVTLNCVTRTVNFVLVHAKANTSPTNISYDRREAGAIALHDSLAILFPEENIVILGDFNDDLDTSITAGETTTSWSAFTNDGVNYTALTLPLSETGKKSTVSHNDVIDHVVVSNEMEAYYMTGSANIVTDVTGVVSSYGTTTSDHYPVFTRYRFEEPAAPVVTVCPEAAAFCINSTGSYTIGKFEATTTCGQVSYSYEITGSTTRNGTGNDASGAFSAGVSTITWTATDVLGNSSTCQTTVTINANPSVTIADGYALPAGTKVNTVYIGYSPASSLTLSASASGGTAGYTYTWQNGTTGASLSVSPTAATTYTVTVTDANGCTATASKEVKVMDVRTGKNGDKVLVCHKYPRRNATLEIGQEGVADHLAHGDQLGGCGMDAPVTQKAQSAEPALQLVLEALPNPSAGVFTLSFRGGDPAATAQLVVTDMLGRVVETRNQLQTNATYTLGSEYHSGVYLLSVLHQGERYTLKLVKR